MLPGDLSLEREGYGALPKSSQIFCPFDHFFKCAFVYSGNLPSGCWSHSSLKGKVLGVSRCFHPLGTALSRCPPMGRMNPLSLLETGSSEPYFPESSAVSGGMAAFLVPWLSDSPTPFSWDPFPNKSHAHKSSAQALVLSNPTYKKDLKIELHLKGSKE